MKEVIIKTTVGTLIALVAYRVVRQEITIKFVKFTSTAAIKVAEMVLKENERLKEKLESLENASEKKED